MQGEETGQPPDPRLSYFLYLILCVQIVRAVLYPWLVRTLHNSPDGFMYHDCAVNLITNGVMHKDAFSGCYWPPLWIMCVAALYRLLGYPETLAKCLMATRSLNVVLWLGALWLIRDLGTRWFSSRVGLLAAALYALDAPFFFIKLTGYEHLVILLTLAVTSEIDRISRTPSWQSGVRLGLLAGFLGLSQAKMLVAAAAIITVAMLRLRLRGVVPILIAAAIGSSLVLTWTVRNHKYSGAFIPISTNGGINVWLANNPQVNAGLTAVIAPPPGFVSRDEVQDDAAMSRAGWQYVRDHPRRVFFELAPRKMYLNWDLHAWHHALRLVLLVWGLCRALASPRYRWPAIMVLTPFAVINAIHFIYCIGDVRYRFPVLPLANIIISWVLVSVAGYLRGEPRD